jgi:hypothetical protein
LRQKCREFYKQKENEFSEKDLRTSEKKAKEKNVDK